MFLLFLSQFFGLTGSYSNKVFKKNLSTKEEDYLEEMQKGS